MKKMKKEGFTLVELMLVIAIIGILAAVLFTMIGPMRERARVAGFKESLKSIGSSFSSCVDMGGTIGSITSADGVSPICDGIEELGAVTKVGQCNGENENIEIQVRNNESDNWQMLTSCKRSGSADSRCVAYCNSGGCVFCNDEMTWDQNSINLPTCGSASGEVGSDSNCR
ncbi:MAG: hypothetical protein CSA81_14080 [Acidobacteria bacterium]|nr:MAG: hypothetical protein CSA81_14080 [Acidobacteriota bacterium]